MYEASPENDEKYDELIKGKILVPFGDHPDFKMFKGTEFLQDMIENYNASDEHKEHRKENPLMIPRNSYYGFYTLTILNYDRIREYFLQLDFFEPLEPTLFNLLQPNTLDLVPPFLSNNFQINEEALFRMVFPKRQSIFREKASVLDYSPRDLSALVDFVEFYLEAILTSEKARNSQN